MEGPVDRCPVSVFDYWDWAQSEDSIPLKLIWFLIPWGLIRLNVCFIYIPLCHRPGQGLPGDLNRGISCGMTTTCLMDKSQFIQIKLTHILPVLPSGFLKCGYVAEFFQMSF